MNEPARRQIASWQDPELNARDWMRSWGFTDVQLTKDGADEGPDIRGSRYSEQAVAYAEDMGIALFHFNLDGRMYAVKKGAADLMKAESSNVSVPLECNIEAFLGSL